ncbi:hypothetical protein QN277_022413 [Acacia crassicarpa]|uniref:Retrotransposon Copia-like N-terminal domain-containing protein n=1 Tax=Acacia crassicarpa TaxID=499986 RepID=A0AAE1MIP4_9FABA|nr:hypothetical protein QN277_022413 [Acacia crassicarpa]
MDTTSSSLAGNNGGDSSRPSSDSTQQIGHPYYLHPNENPSLILVSPVLSDPNYHSWARAMRMALMSKNKTCFIDSSSSLPQKIDSLYSAWERSDSDFGKCIGRYK